MPTWHQEADPGRPASRRRRGHHQLASPGYDQTGDRYDIVVSGGADTLTLQTNGMDGPGRDLEGA